MNHPLSNVETTVTHIGPQPEQQAPPPIGHNKPPAAPSGILAKDQLKAIIARIEHMEEEKKGLSDDIRDIYTEAKGNGFDAAALRTIIKMRKEDPKKREERETILDTYLQAMGMI
jgi:uncharacterized protein (UPF0335 family)